MVKKQHSFTVLTWNTMCLKRQEVLQVQMHDGLQGPPDEGRDEDQNEEVLIAAWLRFERKVL